MRVTSSMFRNFYTRRAQTAGNCSEGYTGIASSVYSRRNGTSRNSNISGRSNTSRRVSGLTGSRLYGSAGTGQIGQTLYKNTQKAASGLREHAEKLLETGEDSLFSKAVKDQNTEKLTGEIREFVEDYNRMITNMKKTGGSLNNIYLTQLETYVSEAKTELSKVGITAKKDGTLAVDTEKLEKAAVDELRALFDGTSSFAGKVSIRSIYAEAGAVSSMANQSNPYYSGYNSYGSYNNTGYGNSSTSYNSILGNWLV
ncbi:MAG: hypothetical protein GX234_12315 [Clostridiales bacterium]|nr:hypothetical protein [Clostridiales bacterium]